MRFLQFSLNVSRTFALRSKLQDCIHIGFIGPHNSGKSSLLHALWKLDIPDRGLLLENRTTSICSYPLHDDPAEAKLFALDFPGSNDLIDQVNLVWNSCNFLASVVVMVFSISTSWEEDFKLVAAAVRRRQKVLIIFTHADTNQSAYKNIKQWLKEAASTRLNGLVPEDRMMVCYLTPSISESLLPEVQKEMNKYDIPDETGVKKFLANHMKTLCPAFKRHIDAAFVWNLGLTKSPNSKSQKKT
jgi:tRNA U34 5-carboxymethylaminomethyl modifying GTPase MnmE/TrmE